MAGKLILVFTVIAVLHHLTESLYLGYGSSNLRRYIQLTQALKYGDKCSWEAEEYRQNFTKNRVMSSRFPNLHSVMELANTIVERNYRLCSAAELFICDKASQKCVCGDPGFESSMGVNRSLYILEGNNKCRWNTNTYCVSDEHLRSQRLLGITVDSKCKMGTSCKLGNGETCSLQAFVRHLVQNHRMTVRLNPRRVTEEVMSGRVCSCKEDQVEVEDDSTENQVYRNSWDDDTDAELSARRRRSISEDLDVSMLAKYVAGTAITI